jgi:hypothetical protein
MFFSLLCLGLGLETVAFSTCLSYKRLIIFRATHFCLHQGFHLWRDNQSGAFHLLVKVIPREIIGERLRDAQHV